MTLFVPRYEDTGRASGAPVYALVWGDVAQVPRLGGAAAWHGLELIEAWFHHGIERGPANFTLVFADGPERVREVWNAPAWKLPPVGETRDVAGLEGHASAGVEPNGALATVTCHRD